MGLPSYLKESCKALLNGEYDKKIDAGSFFSTWILNAGMDLCKFPRANAYLQKANRHSSHVVRCAVKRRWRTLYIPKQTGEDGLTKVSVEFFVGFFVRHGITEPEYRSVTVSKFFVETVSKLSGQKQVQARKDMELKERILKVRDRVYASRTFPPVLRQIILERDNYTCQVCLKDKAAVLAAGVHLEIDHINPWEDGGQTTYINGQTICSGCNSGKHHAKKYLHSIAALSAKR